MTRLVWKKGILSEGVDRGVLYFSGNEGIPWNGLVAVTQKFEYGDEEGSYFDGSPFFWGNGSSDYLATVEAFTYPDGFEVHASYVNDPTTLQGRLPFGLSYREGSRIHLVYNVLTLPFDKGWSSQDSSANPTNFNWDVVARPEVVPGAKPSAHFYIDTEELTPEVLHILEVLFYGAEESEAHLPSVQTILDVFLPTG